MWRIGGGSGGGDRRILEGKCEGEKGKGRWWEWAEEDGKGNGGQGTGRREDSKERSADGQGGRSENGEWWGRESIGGLTRLPKW